MRGRSWSGWLQDPMVVLGAATVMVVLAVSPLGPARAAVNLPLLLLLPGHALALALRSPDAGLELSGRLGLRVVASLGLLGLSLLAVGSVVDLSRTVVVLAVWVVTVGLALIGLVRARPVEDAAATPVWTQSGVLLGLAAAVTTVLVVAGVAVLPEPRQDPFSRLSVTGATRDAGTPLVVTDDEDLLVHVEVENGDEDRSHRFGVVAAIDAGAQWDSVARRIGPGETWTGAVEGPVPEDACVSRLRISLTRDGEPADVNPLILYVRNESGDACG